MPGGLENIGGEIMTYARVKMLIQRGVYDKQDMLNKLDVFLLADRITQSEYQELVELMQ